MPTDDVISASLTICDGSLASLRRRESDTVLIAAMPSFVHFQPCRHCSAGVF